MESAVFGLSNFSYLLATGLGFVLLVKNVASIKAMRVPTTIRKITVPATMAITAPTLIVCNEILAISTDGVVLASGLVERDWTADFEVAERDVVS